MLERIVKFIPYGEFANESEKLAAKFINRQIVNNKSCGDFYIFTNVSLSRDRDYKTPYEIDMILIGISGIKIIEVKHWDKLYINDKFNHSNIINESKKLYEKVKVILGKLKNTEFENKLGFVNGKFFLTKEKKEKLLDKNGRRIKIEGADFYSYLEWKDLLDLNSDKKFTKTEIENICTLIMPNSKISLDPKIRAFEDFINLNLISEKQELFHRVYKGLKKPRRDKIILNLYDLTAINIDTPLSYARREYEVHDNLQKSEYIPRIKDTFREISNYPGELYFFSYEDPQSPSLKKRSKDLNWTTEERIYTAKLSFDALRDFHENSKQVILHRNLNPETIKVRSNNKPLFTELQFARITGATTIAGLVAPEFEKIREYVAPEILPTGFSSCTKESDIYSLCASLLTIFEDREDDPLVEPVVEILMAGVESFPSDRPTLKEIISKFENLYKKPKPKVESVIVEYWDKDTVKELNGRYYRILEKLGKGGVGSTFKVIEVNPENFEEKKSGPYVAKAITNENIAKQAMDAYARVRAQTGGSYIAGVLEVRSEWKSNEITALLKWVEGDPLNDWVVYLPIRFENLDKIEEEIFILDWLKKLCEGLSELHKVGLVHGDVSPKNIIVDNEKVILTDFDLVVKTGSRPLGNTPTYSSPDVTKHQCINLSDDIYSLAASMFHIIFNRLPFKQDGEEKVLNWKKDRDEYPSLTKFFDKATHPNSELRYESAMDALKEINELLDENQVKKIDSKPIDKVEPEKPALELEEKDEQFSEDEVELAEVRDMDEKEEQDSEDELAKDMDEEEKDVEDAVDISDIQEIDSKDLGIVETEESVVSSSSAQGRQASNSSSQLHPGSGFVTSDFIDYLNTLHNANAGNDNALAETQVTNPYYFKIHIDRKIGNILLDKIKEEKPASIILTGHAGDGKTSLVIQILKTINALMPNEKLKESDVVTISAINRDLLYVKDMSELTQEKQENFLKEILEAPEKDHSAILVSNTGPLIETMKRFFQKKGCNKDEVNNIEMKILDGMDMPGLNKVTIEGYNFYVLNVARIDNVSFAPKVIEKLIQEDLWTNCINCKYNSLCPLHNNYSSLKEAFNRICRFCEDFYRWLYENDNRMTIRQILAHITFAITGGLSCNDIAKKNCEDFLFEYHFANLFFGFRKISEIPGSDQLRGIRALKELGLDQKSLAKEDYKLFVRGDFTDFSEPIGEMLKKTWNKFSFNYSLAVSESKENMNLRRSIRRFYLLFSILPEDNYNSLLSEVFSGIYEEFLKLKKKLANKIQCRNLERMIADALYHIFVGFAPQNNNKTLYLTLRRENESSPNVQIIHGYLSYNDIKFSQENSKTDLDNDSDSYDLYIKTNCMDKFKISLPLLDYFKKIVAGGVSTKLHPYLSYGLDKLKANLAKAHSFTEEKEIQVLVNTIEGPKNFSVIISDNILQVYN